GPNHLPVDPTYIPPRLPVLFSIYDIPGHAYDVARLRPTRAQDGHHVFQRLVYLCDKSVREVAAWVPADLPGHEDQSPARGNAIRIPHRPRPALRLKHLVHTPSSGRVSHASSAARISPFSDR